MPQKKKSPFSIISGLITLTLVLSILGLLFVFDASVAEAFNTFGDQYYFLKQHSLRLILGVVIMAGASLVPLDWWQKFSKLFYVLGILSLVLVFIPGVGRELNGAHRWIFINNFRIQPIEFFKLALIVFFADWMSQHQRLLPFLFATGIPSILILLQPDLGSLLILGSIAFGMFFIAGGKITHLLGIAAGAALILTLAITTSSYRAQRLATFLNPQADPLGAGFHIRQITLALGRGGLWGQGLSNSKQKFSYIPEASTDSIFAIIAEEVGFIGSSILLVLFGLYFFLAAKVVNRADDPFAHYLGWGILIWIAAQILLNLAAVVALVPLTGLPLPFFSYGGSSLIMILLTNGILWKIGKEYN